MRYNAVLHYANEEQCGYAYFRFPPNLPANPEHEVVRVVHRNAQQRCQKHQKCLLPTNKNTLPNINHPHHRRCCGHHNNNTEYTSTSTTAIGTINL